MSATDPNPANLFKQTQTILYDPAEDSKPFGERIFGNCFQACVASYFGWRLEAIPHFSQFLWFEEDV